VIRSGSYINIGYVMENTDKKDINRIIIDIDNSINDFCIDNNIESMKNESMSIWNACLIYINNTVFGNGILKQDNIYNSNLNSYFNTKGIKTNLNTYNYDLISDLCDYYILLCYKYKKEVSIMGFSKLSGMSTDCIYNIDNIKNSDIARRKSNDILKKLQAENEETLSNGLFDGSGNPVGKIAILNHRFDWQTAAAAHGIEKKAKSADQLPDFRQNAQRLEDQKNNDVTQ